MTAFRALTVRKLGLIVVTCCALVALSGHAATAYAVPGTETASFTVSSTAPVVGQVVTLDGAASTPSSGATITKYAWDFGDGNTASGASAGVTHRYTATGTYTVTLTVTDSTNATADTQTTVTVGSDIPSAHFTVSPSSPQVNHSATFDGSSSRDLGGQAIASYHWSFGDGTAATTTSARTSHTFHATGLLTATLTVINAKGATSPAFTRTVAVIAPPSAHFTITPARPVSGQTVSFDAGRSTAVAGATIKSYRWSFGDKTSTTMTTPFTQHMFVRPGTVTVSLTITDTNGMHATTSQRLTISPPPAVVGALHVKTCRRKGHGCPQIGLRATFTLSERVQVVITVKHRHRRRTLRRLTVTGRVGANLVRIPFNRGTGRYQLTVQAVGGRSATRRFFWRHV